MEERKSMKNLVELIENKFVPSLPPCLLSLSYY